MAVARFNTDGNLDRSFGTNGSTVIDFYESNGLVRWLASKRMESSSQPAP
jgi:hypothetical protein